MGQAGATAGPDVQERKVLFKRGARIHWENCQVLLFKVTYSTNDLGPTNAGQLSAT